MVDRTNQSRQPLQLRRRPGCESGRVRASMAGTLCGTEQTRQLELDLELNGAAHEGIALENKGGERGGFGGKHRTGYNGKNTGSLDVDPARQPLSTRPVSRPSSGPRPMSQFPF